MNPSYGLLGGEGRCTRHCRPGPRPFGAQHRCGHRRAVACAGHGASSSDVPASKPQQQQDRQQQYAGPHLAALSESITASSGRRQLFASGASAALAAAATCAISSLAQPPPVLAADAPAAPQSTPTAVGYDSSELDTSITAKVYLDVGIADRAYKPAGERTLGDKSVLPDNPEPAGRIVIGLYGNVAPATVANFLALVRSGGLTGTTFSRISPGEYIQAGRQGARRMGEVEAPQGLQPNSDLSSSRAFKLGHSRPGTVSLSLSENDEDPTTRDKQGYRNLEFLITTGPGPVPRLDGLNVVFGRVLQGSETVAATARVPSFQPDIRSRQLNQFASFIGDERAENVRRRYGRPLKAVIITGAGVLGEEGAARGGPGAGAQAQDEGALALLAGAMADVP